MKASGCCWPGAAESFPDIWLAWTKNSNGKSTFPFRQRMRFWITWTASLSREAEWPEILQAELLALPGWAGLMRRLEEDPGSGSA